MVELVWLIPALPLAGFLLLFAFGKRLGEPLAGWLATIMVAASFVVSCVVFIGLVNSTSDVYVKNLFTWIPAGSFAVDLGFYADHLSMTMVLFITGIGALIHLYSIGYMHGDEGFPKFFLYLNLFVFSMLMLVLGSNLLVTFLGWEGVGACSYFLISFWFTKDANASAGKKAFVTNRVGDWGFMVAMFATFVAFGSLNYTRILPGASSLATTTATLIAVMLFIGAVGKSAQIPLYIWLPDAMAGPTPVSALIHAATMVTAGVYVMCRINPILAVADPNVSTLIAWVGVLTALLAATIALGQMDIKKGLAFSTVSQIGYMFLAVGVHAYWAAIFHMITHAFFKACLFLGSGSVIHGMHEEQDMRRLGGLQKYMPITAITFMCAWLAISGIPPFSGFWSKDEILSNALASGGVQGFALYAVGLFAALLTAYYMTRIVWRTFRGEELWREVPAPAEEGDTLAATVEALDPAGAAAVLAKVPDATLTIEPEPPHGHIGADYEPHESPWTMTVPLVVLAIGAVFAGFINLPFGNLDFLEKWLEPVFTRGSPLVTDYTTVQTLGLLAIGAATGATGIVLGWLVWRRQHANQPALEPAVFRNGWYYDHAISWFMGHPGRMIFAVSAWFDSRIIDGAVNAIGVVSIWGASLLRRMQSGYVRRYALGIAVGSVFLLAFVASRVFVK